MKHLIPILFLSLYGNLTFGQKYLDTSFGKRGTLTVETASVILNFKDLSFDANDNIYVTGIYNALPYTRTTHGVKSFPFVHKILPEGKLDNSFGEAGQLTNRKTAPISRGTKSGSFVNKKGYTFYNLNGVTIFNPELDSIGFIQWWAPYRIHLDKMNRLYLLNQYKISRYLDFNTLDKSFGKDGKIEISKLKKGSKRYSTSIGFRLKSSAIAEDDKLYLTAREFGVDTNAVVLDFDNKGEFNVTSAEALGLTRDKEIMTLIPTIDSAVLAVQGSYNSRSFSKLNSDGPDTSFGKQGAVNLDGPEAFVSMNNHSNILPLRDGRYLAITYKGPISYRNFSFILIDEHGQIDTRFGKDGFLKMDFLPGEYKFSCLFDTDLNDNIYIITVDEELKLKTKARQYFISKLNLSSMLPLKEK